MSDFQFPDAILASHTAVLGKTGSGKTSTEKLIVERVVDQGNRVCILDPIKSDWWGITSSASGTAPGLPFRILGGPRGHVPLPSSAGAAIGHLVADGQLPLSIIDMADFEPGGLQRFFVAFAEELMRHMRGVLYLVVEESHEFAPKERAGIGGENLALHFAKRLATAGRSKGIRLIVATQRVQSLHNAVLGSCETIIAHRLTTPADQDPVVKWLKANTDKGTADEVSASLASLPTGTGWLCSGEARIFEQMSFPKFRTYDNAATPKADDEPVEVRTAEVDQEDLRRVIGDAAKEAELNDPKALKARVAVLEKQLAEGRPSEAVIAREVAIAIDTFERRNKHLEWLLGQLFEIGQRQMAILDLEFRQGEIEEEERSLEIPEDLKLPPPVVAPERRAPQSTPPHPSEGLKPKQQAMLDVLADLRALKVDGLDRKVLAGLTGQSPKSSQFDLYLRELRNLGYVDTSGIVRLTEAGMATAHEPQKPPSLADLHRAFKRFLSRAAGRCLDPIIKLHPRPVAKLDIARLSGISPTSSSFDGGLRELRTFGLIEGSKEISATGVLFPKGLK